MAVHDWLSSWSVWFWHLVANHLWQSTLFALFVFALVTLLRKSPARARYTIWLIALAKFALPAAGLIVLFYKLGFDFSALLDHNPASETVINQVAEPMPYVYTESFNDEIAVQKHNEIYCGLTILWFIGFVALLGYWIGQRRTFAFAVKAGEFVWQGKEADSLKRVKSWLLIKRDVRLIVSSQIAEPGVWGTIRPIIILPETIAETLSEAELDAVMMHEMIHLMRRDNLVSTIQMFFCCLFWFHPLVWFIDKRLLIERESACDETVIELGGAHGIYAASLLKVLKFCLGIRVVGVSAASGSDLKRRIEKIMANEVKPKLALSHRAIICVVALAVTLFSIAAGMLSRHQVAAQEHKASLNAGDVQVGILGGVPSGVPGGVAGGIPGGVEGEFQDGNWQLTQDVIKELENAPAADLQFTNKQDAPLTITEASIRAVPYATYRKQGENLAHAKKVFAVRFTVKLTNSTNRLIKAVVLDFRTGDDDHLTYFETVKPHIEPYGTYTFIPKRFSTIMDDPNTLTARVIGVIFVDNEVWGKVPPPPPPAPPPPAPAPDEPSAAPASPLPPGEVKIVRKSGGTMIGSVIQRVEPLYPPEAKAVQVSGSVVVEVRVDEQGRVMSARALSGHPLLRDAALDAARQWVFKPTSLQGEPVKVIGTITFNFAL
jgi:TonB family protein